METRKHIPALERGVRRPTKQGIRIVYDSPRQSLLKRSRTRDPRSHLPYNYNTLLYLLLTLGLNKEHRYY